MVTRHQITAEIAVQFQLSGMPDDEREVAYPKIDIEYTYVKGCPPSFDPINGGDPGWAAEIEMVSATLADGDGLAPTQKQVDDWAQDWLDDKGYDRACQNAEEV